MRILNWLLRRKAHTPPRTIEPYCLKAIGDPPGCPFGAIEDRWLDAPVMGSPFRQICKMCNGQKG